jgi:hypothetical protein
MARRFWRPPFLAVVQLPPLPRPAVSPLPKYMNHRLNLVEFTLNVPPLPLSALTKSKLTCLFRAAVVFDESLTVSPISDGILSNEATTSPQ